GPDRRPGRPGGGGLAQRLHLAASAAPDGEPAGGNGRLAGAVRPDPRPAGALPPAPRVVAEARGRAGVSRRGQPGAAGEGGRRGVPAGAPGSRRLPEPPPKAIDVSRTGRLSSPRPIHRPEASTMRPAFRRSRAAGLVLLLAGCGADMAGPAQ